jgi:hypothetical protein
MWMTRTAQRPGRRGPIPRPLRERIIGRYHVEDGPLDTPCHIWNGALSPRGYAQATVGSTTDGSRRPARLYRELWIEAHGNPPSDHDVHHRCENKACVNLEHYEIKAHGQHSADHAAQMPAPQKTARGQYAMHIRWHVNGRRISSDCPYCKGDTQ